MSFHNPVPGPVLDAVLAPALTGVLLNCFILVILLALSFCLSYYVLAKILIKISFAAGLKNAKWVFRFLTFPGLVVHELSHAAGFIISGYRVKAISFGIRNPDRGGYCEPGDKYISLAVPFVADMITSFAPALAGSAVLMLLLNWVGLRQHFNLELDSFGNTMLSSAGAVLNIFKTADYNDWRTYVFLFLTMSVGVELAPSRVDVKHALPNIFWGIIILLALSFICSYNQELLKLMKIFLQFVDRIVISVNTVLTFGIIMTLVAIISFGILSLPLYMLRK